MGAFFKIVILLTVSVGNAAALEINHNRAMFNYQMLCQGCHTPDGGGYKSVPSFKGFVGNFLRIRKGREYLVKVPGSANADLGDEQLAEILNWIVVRFGEESVPTNWQPYSAYEVAVYREQPLMEVIKYRKQLVKQIEYLVSANKK